MIKVGFCVSYDWELLKSSIPRIYPEADIICLALDKDRKSWGGNTFPFDNEAFYAFIKSIDPLKKIDLYEDCFSLPNLNARENCNRHRTRIAERMGAGGWHIQVDSDEYFLDFKAFVSELKNISPNPSGLEKPINVNLCLVPLIKKVDGGYLSINFQNQIPENAPFATNKPQYLRARNNGHFSILSKQHAIHETWARSEDELWFKINNWGHAAEELEEKSKRVSYFNLWKALDKHNFHYVKNFHPASPATWPALDFTPGNSVEEFIRNYKLPKFPLSPLELKIRNSRMAARFRSLFT